MKINITYIVSNINKANAFEWIASHLSRDKFNLNFILLNPSGSDLENFLKKNNFKVDRIKYHSKKDILPAVIAVYKLLKKQKTKIIHTHLFDASIIGITAGWMAGIRKRIYTRHHSDFHHEFYPQAIKYDKYVNRFSTEIIAVSEVVKNVLLNKESVAENKIHLIHHGFLLKTFSSVTDSVVSNLKRKYNPMNSAPVIGVISRYMKLKGIQYIIPAFKEIIKIYPDALLILANAKGDYKSEIQKLLKTIPEKNYVEIDFEPENFALYKLFDVFIHVPIAKEIEAFGQTYVESLASGIPSVFTLSGVANEFIIDRHNALVVPYKNSERLFEALKELLENKALREQLSANGKASVTEKFELDKMIVSLEQLYER